MRLQSDTGSSPTQQLQVLVETGRIGQYAVDLLGVLSIPALSAKPLCSHSGETSLMGVRVRQKLEMDRQSPQKMCEVEVNADELASSGWCQDGS